MAMLGIRLRQLRDRKGRTQGQIAKYARVPQSTLSDLERGEIAPKTIGALVSLAEFYSCSVDYLLGLTDDPRPADRHNVSEAAVDATNLIDSLPVEKRAATVAVLRAMIELMEVGVPLPEPAGSSGETSTRSDPIWEIGKDQSRHRQLGLPDMQEPTQEDLDRRLALLKKMVPADVYAYVVKLIEAGRALSDADIVYLLDASEHNSLQQIIERFENNHTVDNG